MRTRPLLTSIFATVAVVTIGWQAGLAVNAHQPALVNTAAGSTTGTTGSTPLPDPNPTVTPTPAAPPVAGPDPAPAAPKPAPTTVAVAPPAAVTGNFTGTSVATVYGNVQVQLVVTAGKVTDVRALQLTDNGGRSVQISNYAAPILRSEVISSQSARVAAVSGATYTSGGYLSSVQSALDQAHL